MLRLSPTLQEKLSRIGIVLISIGILVFGTLFAGVLSNRPPSPSPISIEDISVLGLKIATLWEPDIVKDKSATITVCIIPTVSSASETCTPFPGQQATQVPASTNLTPVGTPAQPIKLAFGPNYDVFATTQLSASSFDISPLVQVEQSLDQQKEVDFTWTVTPKYSGKQVLYITVWGIWVSKNGGEQVERPLASLLLNTNVSDNTPYPGPFISLGQITLANLIIILIGSILNIPWIFQLIQKRMETRKRKNKSTEQASTMEAKISEGAVSKMRRSRKKAEATPSAEAEMPQASEEGTVLTAEEQSPLKKKSTRRVGQRKPQRGPVSDPPKA